MELQDPDRPKPCPKCETPLTERLPGGIRFDECEHCKGIYYDRDELRRAKDLAEPDARWLDFDLATAVGEKGEDTGREFSCPGCGATMREVAYQETGVLVDFCGRCRGVWLDKGEFGKIVEALNDQINRKGVGSYFLETIKQGLEVVYGRENLVSEWRDFKTVLWLLGLRFWMPRPVDRRSDSDEGEAEKAD